MKVSDRNSRLTAEITWNCMWCKKCCVSACQEEMQQVQYIRFFLYFLLDISCFMVFFTLYSKTFRARSSSFHIGLSIQAVPLPCTV